MASTAAKKTSAPKKSRSHPPYAEMISEAIVALKERTGSSQFAIAKFIEEKQKDLPSNFRKLLLVQLKKLVASGKLSKIKGSFKLAPAAAKPAAAKPAAPAKPKKAAAGAAKTKAVAPKKKVVVKKAKAATPAKKAKKPVAAKVKKTPVKKPAVAKVKKTPAKKVVKKPKSIKSPAKKAKK
ncbi:histone H1-like [Nicotiana sylvestris]|uniref:Histone H1-like n=1 Tax=Nicotiana sylvestris TaxID=4096 RepID=A0A1U7WI98_NICSY|nr:PREDICTED: histone H1-like [Nicotiana sylvestris]